MKILYKKRHFDKLIEFLKSQNDGLNQLVQFTLETYGVYEYDGKSCECCGDSVENWSLDL